MSFVIDIENNINKEEFINFLTPSFSSYISSDGKIHSEEDDQKLDEWLDLDRILFCTTNGLGYCISAREEGKKLVGMAFIGKQNVITWPDGNKAELFVMAVDVNYRRYKIGSKLLKKSEQVAKDLLHARSVILNTHVDQNQARAFYEANGYKLIGVMENYYDNGNAAFYYKNLY